jgi:hypothetical protein
MRIKEMFTVPGFGGGSSPRSSSPPAAFASATDQGRPGCHQVEGGGAAQAETATRYGRHGEDRIHPTGYSYDGRQNALG